MYIILSKYILLFNIYGKRGKDTSRLPWSLIEYIGMYDFHVYNIENRYGDVSWLRDLSALYSIENNGDELKIKSHSKEY